MKIYLCGLISLLMLLNSCATKRNALTSATTTNSVSVLAEELFDVSRHRHIPVAYYTNSKKTRSSAQKIVIISHGYGMNRGGDYLLYSYLANSLAEDGYYVVSIQHELPTDDLIATEGNIMENRMPHWRRGMENIHFVLTELKKTNKKLDFDHVTLIGHSNGGDMSVLFAHQHPEMIQKVISLDNRRMPLPRVASPRIYTIRSNDYPADAGVLPSDHEATQFAIKIQFTNINHSNMDDDANAEERKVILDLVHQYLND